MTFPQTTREQAKQLVGSFEPFPVKVGNESFILYAEVIEAGEQPVVLNIDGKPTWCTEPAYNVVFKGGKWGEYTIRCAVSSCERIEAHWEGYKATHVQVGAKKAGLARVPAGAKYQPTRWVPKVGDRVFFNRGMFGKWQGTIQRFYQARGHIGMQQGTPLCDVTCIGRNGKMYLRRGIRVSSLTKGGVAAFVEG